jgi:hypothetical protein
LTPVLRVLTLQQLCPLAALPPPRLPPLQSARTDGVTSLYKGFLPTWMRIGPWAVVM